GLVESQLTVQLGHGLRRGLEVDDGVDTLGLLVDLVREAPAAPHVELLHRATRRPNHIQILIERRGDGALLETSVEDHHDLVMTQDVLTSYGLSGRGPSAAGGRASSSSSRSCGTEPEYTLRCQDRKRPRGASSASLGGTWGGTTTPVRWMTAPR